MHTAKTPWLLACAVVNPCRAPEQTDIVIRLLGRTFDTERDVYVADEEIQWQGPVEDWVAAVAEAAVRPAFPHPRWEPGPYEAKYLAED